MGTEYFRVVPRSSRSSDIVIAAPSASRSRTRRRRSAFDVGVQVETRRNLDDPLLLAQQREQLRDDDGRGPAFAFRSATSGGLKPPAAIASASSFLSFRSPWLSFGS